MAKDASVDRTGAEASPLVAPSRQHLRPFEWLTSPASLEGILEEVCNEIQQSNGNETTTKSDNDNDDGCDSAAITALHIGCGSSLLGEYLVKRFHVSHVVNADRDDEMLEYMRQRPPPAAASRLEYIAVDFCQDSIPFPDGYFNIIVDKSTLDCTLCSDDATSHLLCEVHRLLARRRAAAYIVISFHTLELLIPLLRDCPGTSWDVTHTTITRQVEDLLAYDEARKDAQHQQTYRQSLTPHASEETATHGKDHGGESHMDGSTLLHGDEHASSDQPTVHVLVCRSCDSSLSSPLVYADVCHHVHQTNDKWFRHANPLLTRTRRTELEQAFRDNTKQVLDLTTCYQLLFTNAEREHLTFQHFLEDWHAFCNQQKQQQDPPLCKDGMSLETALAFLEVMQ